MAGVLNWSNNGIYNTQNSQQTCEEIAVFESCGARTIKGRINLYFELQKHKLGQIAALDKRIAFSK